MKKLLLLLTGLLLSISSIKAQNPGELDLTFNPDGLNFGDGANSTVRSMINLPDGKILIGGLFTSYNGTNINRIARINANGSLDTSFNPGIGANNLVQSMVLQPDGKILIGGDFPGYNGTTRNYIARINADGSLDTTFNPGTGANSTVRSIVLQPDGKILIGGDFPGYNGTTRNYIARINVDGSLDTSFNPGTGASSTVQSMVPQPDGKILIGGQFNSYNGTGRNYIARINADGSLDTSFNPGTGANGTVLSMVLQPDGKILIGGNFTSYNGTTRNYIARINADGSLDTSFNPGTGANFTVWSMVLQPDGKILIGGDFTGYNGTTRNYIARINADGSLDTSFNPGTGANFTVWSMVLQPDGKILIGGDFTGYNGTTRNYIARINADGSLDTSFNPGTGANSTVRSIVLQPDGKIIIGGQFTSYNGASISRIARINADGSLDGSFNPGLGANGFVRSMVLQPDGKILIGGDFSSYNGTSRSRIARINADGSLDGSFNPGTGANNMLLIMVLQPDGKILIGGFFTSYNGIVSNRIARLNSEGSLDNSFNSGIGANGTVWAMALQLDGKILIGGDFTTYNGININRIARLNDEGSLDTSFNPAQGPNGQIQSILTQTDGKVLIGGFFNGYNFTNRNNFGRLNLDGGIDTSFNPGTGPNFNVLSIVFQSDGKILIGGSFTAYNQVSRVRIARIYGGGEALDEEAPSADLETLEPINAQCQVNFDDLSIPTSTDLVDGIIQGITDQTIFPITAQGITTITWTYTDDAGNESSQTQEIIIDDTTAPIPTLETLADVTGECAATVTTVPTALDNCQGTITGTTEDPLTYHTQGTHTVTWKFDDGNGNTSQQT
ncbi:delta-60 repeat domain-containing protein, partial [Algoriphagus alkaliphilus]